ncbi:FAD/NAD(P)-binding domain-containing protein [Sistotremastrum suecicum HHB10207 ss-3]|uniref:FAD/NAD(P)-binding domain-containing protein n=1 Tax=Sistotremastrum suecicum HHB10207 ss-3 TaxID=1314776 RepID=A0A166C4I8_9AGAM|nr:FAD/NAD(P)-binding domain-containing protein [Sistotremastrum suecicum HHB10207 ss-3]
MKIVVIGAGFSGIIAAIRIPQRVKNVELTIYDKESGIGGTWFTNKYPGLACDIPAHCYQLTFEPNPNWSAFYAPGPEILQYLQSIVQKYKLLKYIKLRHELTGARYNSQLGKWELELLNRGTGERVVDSADLVLSSTGSLSRWRWPDIEGLGTFRGEGGLLHSAEWESDLGLDAQDPNAKNPNGKEGGEGKWKDKKVAVIGVGSSAIQIVPALQKRCGKVVNFVRGQTWIATPMASAQLLQRNPNGDNHTFTEEEKARFVNDPEYYRAFRKELEVELNSVHGATQKDHPMQLGAVKAFREMMQKKLEKKPWIADSIIPDFPVACRRLTPGPGYLEALVEPNVDFVNTPIKRITEKGIETSDGKEYEFDVIVCATGFDTSFKPPYPVLGRSSLSLSSHFTPHPRTYLSITTDSFPSLFFTLGPSSAVGSGSLLCIIERQVDYFVKVVLKVQRERIKSVEVRKEAVDDFEEYLEAYFPQTVYSQKCRSWYKMGQEEGRVSALWPGSCLHAVRALAEPRWEDYQYEYLDEDVGKDGRVNRFKWLGDGWTVNERSGEGDRAWYLEDVDYPPGTFVLSLTLKLQPD